jgi:hypothetical protein
MARGFADSRKARQVLVSVSIALILGGCAGSAHSAPPSPQATGSKPAGASASTPATQRAGASARNLVADSAVRASLLAAYATAKRLPEDEVTGPLPGTLYYGTVTASGTYWAVATFGLTSSAPFEAEVNMQDGGNIGVFSRTAAQPWTVRLGGIPFPCPGELPAELMSVWGMTSPGSCIVSSAESPARAQASIAGALYMPAGSYFGVVLYEQLDLKGDGAILFEPETWQGTSGPASHLRLYYALDIGPRTVAGYWTGTSRSASHKVLGSFDLAFAQRVESAMVPFTTQPLSGYEVTVSVDTGCTPACSNVAKIVQMNSVAPLPANPAFTEPAP